MSDGNSLGTYSFCSGLKKGPRSCSLIEGGRTGGDGWRDEVSEVTQP